MIDCDAILYAHLVATGTPLRTLVADRIAYGDTPDGFANTATQIVFLVDDGDGDTSAPVYDRTYLFHCYGGSNRWADATAVYRALHGRLHGLNMERVGNSGVIMAMHEDDTGGPIVHPGTKHKLITCRFRGKFKEI